jgi:prepilin-type N-terminal cleavage/methylation domain-containing protein
VSRVRDLRRADGGFSLVEVMVALVLFALVCAAVIPVFVVGAKAAVSTRLETQGKNLAQQRVESMRQLAYHVDRQNGPFVDLLDYYYPNRVAAAGTGEGWVAETSTARLPGEPTAGAFYRTVIDPVPGEPRFSQVVATQFLTLNRAPVSASMFTAYDSQTAGVDGPASSFLGVTVITTWTDGTQARSSEVFTQIADEGRDDSLVVAQSRVTTLRVESAGPAPSLNVLTAEAGSVSSDGRTSDGSTASVEAVAGRATRQGNADVEAAHATALSPGGSQPNIANEEPVRAAVATCGYAAFGRSRVDRVTSTIVDGVPFVPADVGLSATPANRSSSALLASAGGDCGAFWFSNLSDPSFPSDPRLQLVDILPLVSVPDPGGSAPVVEGSAWLNATSETATPRFVRAGAAGSTATPVDLFRTLYSEMEPLLRIQLVGASIECDSRVADAEASYRVVIDYRRFDGVRVPIGDFSWSAASVPSMDPLAGLDLSTYIVDQTGLTLADYIGSWSLGTTLQESSNGLASLDAALRITTTPLRGSTDPTSSVGISLGSLTCVADDNR